MDPQITPAIIEIAGVFSVYEGHESPFGVMFSSKLRKLMRTQSSRGYGAAVEFTWMVLFPISVHRSALSGVDTAVRRVFAKWVPTLFSESRPVVRFCGI